MRGEQGLACFPYKDGAGAFKAPALNLYLIINLNILNERTGCNESVRERGQ